MRKKRVKFAVELVVSRLTDVPLLNAILFAKVRLMDGGTFEDFTKRGQVTNFTVVLESKFEFICRVPADIHTGELEECRCKISVRKVIEKIQIFESFLILMQNFFDRLIIKFLGGSRRPNSNKIGLCDS